MHEAGSQSVAPSSILLRFINWRINYRNHNKIVVIDSDIGYVGGYNVSDEYLGKAAWLLGVIHIRIAGDASLFLVDWNAAIKKEKDVNLF